MKTRKKGILFFAVVAGIMLSFWSYNSGKPCDNGLGILVWMMSMKIPTAEDLDALDVDALGLELDIVAMKYHSFAPQMN